MKNDLCPDYGNWVPKRLLYLLGMIAVVIVVALVYAIVNGYGYVWTAAMSLALLIDIAFLVYMFVLHRAFSLDGDALMVRIHNYLVERLPWDGKGRLLDVGCGSGALTIRCAKKFPQAQCTGIDYWGIKWDYSINMCQQNAIAEGVAMRCSFQHSDANNLDFADETFDAVVSNFVYHEVSGDKSKEQLIRESLRVLKKGGAFALQDLFGQSMVYGDFQKIVDNLKANAVTEIHYVNSVNEIPVPKWMQLPGMLPGVGIIYGIK